ncbi:MAG: hypothetical protein ACREKN_09255 [Longimicrobiaceae bacterium]
MRHLARALALTFVLVLVAGCGDQITSTDAEIPPATHDDGPDIVPAGG